MTAVFDGNHVGCFTIDIRSLGLGLG